jgi:hypothetical protein
MSIKNLKTLSVANNISHLKCQPYIAELFIIMAGVLITTISILGSGRLIATISDPSLVPSTPESTKIHVFH